MNFMKHFSEAVLAIFLGLCIVLLTNCSGKPPIKKGCQEIGATSSGVKLFEACQDL